MNREQWNLSVKILRQFEKLFEKHKKLHGREKWYKNLKKEFDTEWKAIWIAHPDAIIKLQQQYDELFNEKEE